MLHSLEPHPARLKLFGRAKHDSLFTARSASHPNCHPKHWPEGMVDHRAPPSGTPAANPKHPSPRRGTRSWFESMLRVSVRRHWVCAVALHASAGDVALVEACLGSRLIWQPLAMAPRFQRGDAGAISDFFRHRVMVRTHPVALAGHVLLCRDFLGLAPRSRHVGYVSSRPRRDADRLGS